MGRQRGREQDPSWIASMSRMLMISEEIPRTLEAQETWRLTAGRCRQAMSRTAIISKPNSTFATRQHVSARVGTCSDGSVAFLTS
jgi:hypothetical protein